MNKRLLGLIALLLTAALLATGCSAVPSIPQQPVITSTQIPAAAPTAELPTPETSATVAPQATETTAPTGVAPAPTLANTPAPTMTRTSTRAPVQLCNNASFVTDVTVPDGTLVAPGQVFDKIWRMRNTGTCAWTAGYTFAPAGGTELSTAVTAVPPTAPRATADLPVPMTAPVAPGGYTSLWRMRAPNGTYFGPTIWVKITVITAPAPAPPVLPPPIIVPTIVPLPTATPVPAACAGTPIIASFGVSPTAITAGSSATLSWGLVGNANEAIIDQGIGGVATPGSTTVSPTTTTTYTLTALCGSTSVTASVTLSVIAAAPTLTPVIVPTMVPPTTITPVPHPPTPVPAMTPTRTP